MPTPESAAPEEEEEEDDDDTKLTAEESADLSLDDLRVTPMRRASEVAKSSTTPFHPIE